MKLLVGLGNPGEEYTQNRHNVGFMFADYIYSIYKPQQPWKYDKYLQAEFSKQQINNDELIILKPQTFMNGSGKSIVDCIKRYNINSTQDLVVAHDELDISLGKFKIQMGTGPKLHNGLDSINEHLKTNTYWRIRIGVDNRQPEKRIPGETYVLQDFTQEERKVVEELFPNIRKQLHLSLPFFPK